MSASFPMARLPKFILALDQGTTSSRALLFDHDGRICGIAQEELTQYYPQAGWVEHDPAEIWATQLRVAQQVLHEQGIHARDIAAIGIANQRETTLLWDRRTGIPIAPAIVWQDRRTADDCEAFRAAGHSELVRRTTGLEIDAYFSASKIRWMLSHVPNARTLAEKGHLAFGTVDSWLAYKLCGRHVTDHSNASRTMLLNIHTMRWDGDMLALFDIPQSLLPELVCSSGMIGTTHEDLFGMPVAIAALAGDQQAAAFGQVCCMPGMVKNTYGTGCFMLLNTGNRAIESQHRLLSTSGCTLGAEAAPTYFLEGSVFMAGAIVQWLRDGLHIIQHAEEVEKLAASVEDSDGTILVPAFVGLGAPYWDSYARAAILGMSRSTTDAHLARAALESIAYQTSDMIEAMQKDTCLEITGLRVDGGASRNDLLMQCQADTLGIPVTRPLITETTALGAAQLAGIASGFWESVEDINSKWQVDRIFEPCTSSDARFANIERWHRAVQHVRQLSAFS